MLPKENLLRTISPYNDVWGEKITGAIFMLLIHKTTITVAAIATITATLFAKPKSFDEVNEGYTKVVSTVDGSSPLFGLWKNSVDLRHLANQR